MLSCIKKFHTWCYSAHGERGAEKWRIESRINKRPRAHCHKVQQCGYFFHTWSTWPQAKIIPYLAPEVPKYSRSSPFSAPTHTAPFESSLLAHILEMLLGSKINSHISSNFCPDQEDGRLIIKALNAN